MRCKLLILLCLFCLIPTWSLQAASTSGLTDKIQKQYQSLNTFTADFTQILKNATSKEEETRSGQIFFSQPALIRWETTKPEKELLVVGKDAVWNTFEDDKSAYRYGVEEILGSKTMLRFLSGQGNLKEDFNVEEVSGASQGQVKLKLTPREAEPGLVLAYVWVNTSNYMLTRIQIEDFYGNINDVSLANVKFNIHLNKDLFQYAPPKDYQVFDNTKPKQSQK